MFKHVKSGWLAGVVVALMLGGCSAMYKADQELAQSNYSRAIALYQEYLVEHPDSTDARRNLGLAQLRAGQADAAVGELRRVLQKDGKDAFAHLYLGLGLMYQGRIAEGIASMERFDAPDQPMVGDEVKFQVSGLRNKLAGRTPSAAEAQAMARETDQAIATAVARQKEADRQAAEQAIGGGAGGGCGC
jgi:tetratricopeptide (TPR) repeat protein